SRFQVQNKVTGAISLTVSTAAFWAPVLPPTSTGVQNTRMLFDPLSQRWVFAAVSDVGNGQSSLCIAVTPAANPRDSWYLFRFDVDPTDVLWAEYPMLGFNKDWIVVSLNRFAIADMSNAGGQLFVFNKTNL